MAKQLNVNLSFTADTSQAAAQVRSLQQSLTQLINQPVGIGERLSADMLKATQAAAELKMHLQSATNVDTGTLDFGKLNQSLKASGVSLQQYATQLQSLGPKGQQTFMQLARSVANAEVPLRRSNALLSQFSTTLANTARWQLSSSMLHGFISAVSTAWNYSQDLNESLNNIRIVTGKNIDQMSRFADQANRAAKALSTTTTEYTNASLIYYQQGLSDAEVLGRTETTIKMANASRQSAEVVSDQMTAIWNNFYDGSKSLEYYADVVTALGAATASSSEEIAQGLEKFAAVADTVGLSYEYATAALATVTATTRQSADVVGTAFKTLFARLSDLKLGETLDDGTTLGSYSDNLAKIGVNIKDASGQLKDMDTILNETAAKWENLDKAQQVALAKGVAGIRQYTQFIALMDNWDFMEENLNTANKSGGTLAKQAKTYEESWEAASKRVKASLETIYAAVMDDEFFIDLTNGFAKLIDKVGGFVKSIGGLQGVLSGLGWILTKVFAEQMTQGFQNLYYNIQMSSQAGRQAMQDLKMKSMQAFADSMVTNPDGATQVDLTRQQVYKDELIMQQQLMEKADQLTASEQNKYKILIEQHRVMGEQSIELAQQLELTKERMANSSTELLGTGLNNGVGMTNAMGAIGYARESAQSMATIEQALQKIGSTSKITTAQVEQLKQEFQFLGLTDDEILELSNALQGASGNAGQMEEAIIGVRARMSQLTGVISGVVADLLGVEPGSQGFAELSQRVAQYMGHAQQAKIQTDNLKISTDNGKISVDRFGDSLAGAGQKAQSAAQLLSTAVSGLMSLGMLISSVTGLIDTIKDPDASGWEKFGRILTSVSMIAMSTMGAFAGLKAGYELLTSGVIKNTLITTANSVASAINEKQQRKNNATKGAGVVVGKSATATTRQGTTATYHSTAALRKENAEKRKSIALDKMRGKTVKKPTIDKSPKLDKGALKTIGKAAGRWAAGAAAIAIVATTVTLATESYNKHNKAAKEASEQAKEAANAFGQVSQAYSDFTSKVDSYTDATKGLEELTKGTDEYREAIIKANDATIELLNQYEDLQYSINEEGLIVLDETTLREVKKREEQRVKDAQMANLSAQQNARNKQLEADSINFQRDKLRSDNTGDLGEIFGNGAIAGVAGAAAGALGVFALTNAWNPAGWAAAIIGGVAAIVGGIVTASVGQANEEENRAIELLSQEYAKNGNARFADAESFRALLKDLNITDQKLIDSLVENRAATLELAKEMALNNNRRDNAAASQIFDQYENVIKSYGLTSEQAKDVSGMIGASMDSRIDALYEKTYKDKGHLGGGITDAEVQKQYAAAMGWAVDTIENQSGNKAKYYKKDGTEVGVISDEVARRYLAEKAAYKDLEQAVRDATKQFVKLTTSAKVYENAMADFLTAGDFSTMTNTEFTALLTQVGGEDGEVSQEEAKKYVDDTFAYGEELTDEEAQAYGFSSAQAFYDAFVTGFKSYEEDRSEVLGKISTSAQTGLTNAGFNLDDLSNTALKQVGSVVDTAIAQLGDGAGVFMSDIFSIAGSQAGELAVALGEIDWAQATPESVIEALELAGIAANYTEEELNGLIHVMQAGFVQSIDDINKKIVILDKMSKLKQGDTIDADQYNELSDAAQSYFTKMADGTYKLTQDAQDFYNVVNNEMKAARLSGLEADIANSVQTKNSIQYSKDTLTTGNKTNYGYDTYEEYIKKSFANHGHMSNDAQVKDGQLVMPYMWNRGSYYWVDNVIGLSSTAVALNDPDEEAIYAGKATKNDDGTTTYGWSEVLDTDVLFGTTTSSKISKERLYDPVTVYTNETDYMAAKMKTTTDQTSMDQAAKQVEYLKSTSFGLDKANAATIKAWENAIATGTLTGEAAAKIAETTNQYIGEYEGLVAKDKELLSHIGDLAFQHLSETESAAELEAEYKKLMDMAQNELQKQEIQDSYTGSAMAAIAEEKNEGLDPVVVDAYADHLMEAAKASDLLDASMSANTEEAKEIADEVARYTMKMNKGVEKLADGFEEWNSILKESNEASEEYHNAMIDIKDAMSDVLGVDEEFLTDSFIKDHLPLIEEAAEGSAEAIDKLAIAAAQSILLDVGVDNGALEADLLALQTDMMAWIPDDIKVGATLESDGFKEDAQALINAAGMTVQEAQAYFNSLGYEPEFVTEEKEVEQRNPITVTETEVRGYKTGTASYTGVDGKEYTTNWQEPILARSTYNDGYTTSTGKMDVVALGSNGKTPKIKSLTKKSSGSMNNYSGSNSGGKSAGGGGSKPEKTKRTKKVDMVDRYKEVNDKIDDTQKRMNDASKAADRLWGPARLEQMQKVNSALEDEIGYLKDKRKEAEYNLKQDKIDLNNAASALGAKFSYDNNGNISNYEEQMNALYQSREDMLDEFGDTLSESEKEKLDAFDEKFEALKTALSQYDDTRELAEDLETEIQDKIYEWQDNNYKELNLTLEYKIEINDSKMEVIDYYMSKLEDDVYATAEAYAYMNQQTSLYNSNLAAQEQYVNDLTAKYEAGEISLQAYKEGLANSQSAVISNLQSLEKTKQAMQDYYGNVMNMALEKIAVYTDEMEHLNSVLDHYSSIMELVGKQDDYASKNKILTSKANNIKGEMQVQKELYDKSAAEAEDWAKKMASATEGSNEYETYKKNWQAAQAAANDAQDQMLAKTQEWAEAMKSIIENELAELADTLEKSLTGGISFDELLTSMDRRSSLQEEYLTTTNKIYETNKMMRTAQQEIDKTSNTVAKKKLQNFINETNQLQNQTKLSQYELDIQQAKYDLLLAEIALEEAQQAKSTVRLRRDAEGNFGYVYTADASQVADAEQKLADAQNNLYNIGLEGANNYQQKYAETLQEAQDAITELTQMWMNGEISSEEEFNRRKQEITTHYGEKLKQYSELHTIALSTDSRVLTDAWSSDFIKRTVSVETWKTEVDNYFSEAATSMEEWAQVTKTVMADSGLNDMDKTLGDVDEKSKNLIKTLLGEDGKGGVVGAMMSTVEAAGTVSEAHLTIQNSIDTTIGYYEKLLTTINNAHTAMTTPVKPAISTEGGSYTPSNGNGSGSGSGRSGNGSGGGNGYDNQGYSTEVVKKAQQYVGASQDGKWGPDSRAKAKAKVGSENIADVLAAMNSSYQTPKTYQPPKTYQQPKTYQAPRTYQTTPRYSDSWSYNYQKPRTYGSYDTGGYTGEWGSYGKLAILHEKELVLNKHQTENMLAAMEFLSRITTAIDLQAMNNSLGGLLSSPSLGHVGGESGILEQQVHIEASFPGVSDRNELEEAFNNLINQAAQYANRK